MSKSEANQKQPDNDPMYLLRPENQPYSQEREESYKAKFPYLDMSPEEYVARNSHTILCFSLHRFKYRDERLQAWLQAVVDHLKNYDALPALREQFLSKEELAVVTQFLLDQEKEFENYS